MRKNISTLLDEAKSKLAGFIGLYTYRLMNLCVKAEVMSLLSIQVKDGETLYNLEMLADAYKVSDYDFCIVPNNENLMPYICKAVSEVHPEFKQEIQKIERKGEDPEKLEYLILTMPEVNKDRYDVLTDAVDVLSKECLSKINLTCDIYTGRLTTKIVNLGEDEKKEALDLLKDLHDRAEKNVNEYKAIKTEEIEKAYEHYQEKQELKEEKEEKEDKNNDKSVGQTMKMFGMDDDDE